MPRQSQLNKAARTFGFDSAAKFVLGWLQPEHGPPLATGKKLAKLSGCSESAITHCLERAGYVKRWVRADSPEGAS